MNLFHLNYSGSNLMGYVYVYYFTYSHVTMVDHK